MTTGSALPTTQFRDAVDQVLSSLESSPGRWQQCAPAMDQGALRLVLALEFLRLWSEVWLPAVLGPAPEGDRGVSHRRREVRRTASGPGKTPMPRVPHSASRIQRPQSAFGPLRVVRDACEAYYDNRPLVLSPHQFKVLTLLVEAQGRVVRYDPLVHELWGSEAADTHQKSLLRMPVQNLRRRLAQTGTSPTLVQSLRGFGYRIRPVSGSTALSKAKVETRPAVS